MPADHTTTTPANAANKTRVMLIEDSRSEAVSLQIALKNTDPTLEVMHAPLLEKGVALLQDNPVDIILLDLGLPDSNGLKSIMLLTRLFPHVPIIVLSGHNDEISVLKTLKYGAQNYLVKGECTLPDIQRAIHDAVSRKNAPIASLLTDKEARRESRT